MVSTHGIDSTLRAYHRWTKDDLPSEVYTVHDFKDGNGFVPAVPFDIVTEKECITKLSETRIDNSTITETNCIDKLSETRIDNSNVLETTRITDYLEIQMNNSTVVFSGRIIDCQEISS